MNLGLASLGLALTACSGAQSSLEPAGQGAREIARLSWIIFAMAGAIFLAVTVLLLVALFRPRRSELPGLGQRGGRYMVVGGGLLLPFVVLPVLITLMISTLRALQREGADTTTLQVEVVARDWFFEFRYPESGVVTATELHLPIGEPVEITGTSEDVIHSLWMPSLHGKIDLIPGREHSVVVTAEKTGRFRGQCAEFCGIQHARMAFYVIVEERSAFDAWIKAQAAPAAMPPSDLATRGRDIFLSKPCAACHAIRGTEANGRVGPDLTHVASREWLAGGAVRNTPSGLESWIRSPQSLKPGANMPAVPLLPDEQRAVLAYLTSLE